MSLYYVQKKHLLQKEAMVLSNSFMRGDALQSSALSSYESDYMSFSRSKRVTMTIVSFLILMSKIVIMTLSYYHI